MFDYFMTEKLKLIKKDSSTVEDVKASVQDKIYINDTSLPIEEGDLFEYTNPAKVVEYLRITKVQYYNHPRLGHIEIDYKKTEALCRVYLDTNIISRVNDSRIKEKDAKALHLISERIDREELKLFTSAKAKEEVEKTKEVARREFLLFIYNLVKKIPNTNLLNFIPATLGSAPLGVATLGGGYSVEDPIFTKLKVLFDKDDAEHIFRAEKARLDYFLTLDRKSIIDRITQNPDKFRRIGLRINIVLPIDLLSILESRKT